MLVAVRTVSVRRWLDFRARDGLTQFPGSGRLGLCYGGFGGVVGAAVRGAAAASERASASVVVGGGGRRAGCRGCGGRGTGGGGGAGHGAPGSGRGPGSGCRFGAQIPSARWRPEAGRGPRP